MSEDRTFTAAMIQMRTGLSAFSTLTPRQAVTPAPYAMFAPTAANPPAAPAKK